MLLARLLVNRSSQPLTQAYHGLLLTTSAAQACTARNSSPHIWAADYSPQSVDGSLVRAALSNVLASGIPGVSSAGGVTGSASAERSTGLPGAATGGSAAAESSTGLSGPSGRGAEAGVGLRSPTDAPSAEGSIGQQDPVPDTDAEAAAGASGADSSVAERQPGDAPREPSADGAADAEGSRSGAGTVPEQAAAAAGEQQDAAGAATATAGGGPGRPPDDDGDAETVITSTRTDPLLYSLLTPFQMLRGMMAATFVKQRIELDFQLEEFLESAKDAFFMVQKLFMAGDTDSLQDMVSPAVMDAFRRDEHARLLLCISAGTWSVMSTISIMAATNTRFKLLEHAVGGAFLSTVQLRSAEDFARLVAASNSSSEDRQDTSSSEGESVADAHPASGMFLVAVVHFSGTMKLQRNAPGVREILTDKQSQVWSFARGPLPETMPVRRLESDWMLVGIA